MSFDLFDGVVIQVQQPVPPIFRADPPVPSNVVVVPVAGPPGPTGPAGQDGEGSDELADEVAEHEVRITALEMDGGGAGSLRSYRHTQNSPASLVMITHPLTFTPAGVRCTDTLDQLTEPDKIHNPQLGVTEVIFGSPFSGAIDLS